MARESIQPVPESEDPVRRSVGYYGEDQHGRPARGFDALDALYKRDECGTDLFIPGFTGSTSDESWVKDILKEVAENFLYSFYSGKLEVKIEKRMLTRNNLGAMLDWIGSKDARIFYEVIRENPNVQEMKTGFYKLGTLNRI